jgi:chemotaxis protein CheX
MNLHDRIVGSIRESTCQVLSTMLGIEAGPGIASTETTPPEANEGLLSFIGLAGPLAGTGSLACSATLACHLCSQLLMTEATSVNEEVLDAIAELTNMILGNVKTDLENELGVIGLSIPTVIFGKNFKAKTAINAEWHVVRFDIGEDVLQVRLCLTPRDQAPVAPLFHGLGHTCPVDV